MPIIPAQIPVPDFGKAIGQGTQNALAQAQLMSAGQQMQQRNALAPLKQRQAELGAQSAEYDYVVKRLGMVNDQNTYDAARQEFISKGMPENILGPKYDPDAVARITGRKSPETFGAAGPIEGMPGYAGQRSSTTGQYSNIKKIEQSMPAGEVDPIAPWVKIRDAKKQDEARIRFGALADRKIEKLSEEASSASSVNDSLDRFIQLNKTNVTGPAFGVPILGSIASGTRSAFDPEFQEMKSISDRLTPQMRQGMPGAASDRDVAMFRGATVGVEKSPEANINIATGLKVANQNKIDMANFYSQYATERGHIRGAEKEWKQYLEANPIFDPKAPKGAYQINESRLSYDEWKGQQSGQMGQRPIGAPTTQPTTPQSAIPEGSTATNPQTGQRIIYRGGQWMAM